ncbi:MAG: STAS domain-containing protein [Actinomycetota bacterium]
MGLEIIAGETPDAEFALRGELDLATAGRLLEVALTLPSGCDVRLDVSELHFADSSGIRAMLKVVDSIRPGTLILVRPMRSVHRVLEVLGIDQGAGIVLTE